MTSYGVSYFLIPHSLWPTPFKGWALLDCRLFFLQPTLLLLSQSCHHFLPYHSAIPAVMLFDSSLLGLLLILLSMTQYGHLGFVLHFLWTLLSHLFPLGHPRPFF